MARVIMQGECNAVSRIIADVLELDERDFFYVLTTEEDCYCIHRGNNKDYNGSKSAFGAKYYATLLQKTEYEKKGLFELAEWTNDQINIYGYFKSPKRAAKSLLKFGNTSCEGRKPSKVYR